MSNRHRKETSPVGKPLFFGGVSADDAWVLAAKAVLDERGQKQVGRGGETIEILHATIHIADPRQRWILSRRPAMNPAFAIAEAFWILGGRDDAHFVNFWNPALPQYAGPGACYSGAYGKRLRESFSLDQIEGALDALSAAPNSRQVVLQIWNPRSDFPASDGTPASPDVPCNLCSIVKIRNERLHWLQVMRSNDLFRGSPYNIVQFTILQEYMAGCLGVELGDFVLIADSLHAYSRDIEKFTIAPLNQFPSNCRIALPRDQAAIILKRCIENLDWLADPQVSEERFLDIVRAKDLPTGHADLIRIAAADSARRRGWRKLESTAADACTDGLLRLAWSQWESDRLKFSK